MSQLSRNDSYAITLLFHFSVPANSIIAGYCHIALRALWHMFFFHFPPFRDS